MSQPKVSKSEKAARRKEIFKAPRNSPGAEPGTLSWCYQTVGMLELYWQGKILSERDWLKVLGELKEYEVWNKIPPDKPYGSLDALLRAEVGVDEDVISKTVASTPQEAREMPLVSHGGDRKSELIEAARSNPLKTVNQGDNSTLKRGSTSKSYLLRRMARDFPEALDKLEAGEYKSARQAAIACGIVKVKPPLDVALTAYNKLSDDEKKAFLEQINA